MFVLSKLLWIFLQPLNLAVFLTVGGLAWSWSSNNRTGMRLAAAATGLLLAVTLLPLDQWLAAPLESRYPRPNLPRDITGILVLGGDSFDARLIEGAALARAYPKAKLVFSGGSGDILNRTPIEADVARGIFERLGVPRHQLTFEDKSRSTWENILLSKKLLRPKQGENWILVTSASHLPRAMGVAAHLGWHMIPWPAAFISPQKGASNALTLSIAQNAYTVDVAVHEWVGLFAYRLEGRTDSFWP